MQKLHLTYLLKFKDELKKWFILEKKKIQKFFKKNKSLLPLTILPPSNSSGSICIILNETLPIWDAGAVTAIYKSLSDWITKKKKKKNLKQKKLKKKKLFLQTK